MRVLDGEQVLVRIFIGESDQWHHQPLSHALLERLRQMGCAGATVLHGTAGFGAKSVLHTADLLRLSQDLPVVIELVDTREKVDEILPVDVYIPGCPPSPVAFMEGLLLLQDLVGRERRPISWAGGPQGVERPHRPSLRERKRTERQRTTRLRSPDEI